MNTQILNQTRSSLYAAGKLTLTTAGFLLISACFAARAQDHDNRAPDVPASLQTPEGNKVCFHTYAVGVQIYAWNGSSWVFQAPEAVLFADAGHHGEVAIHYAGPTWESDSGSTVVGAKVAGVTVDPTAIPWLLLRAVSNDGSGVFADVTFIQRVNTSGGLAPASAGTSTGEIARVPYSAEYYFYRAD